MEPVGDITADVNAGGSNLVEPLPWLSAILWPDGDARLLADRRRNRPGGAAHVVTGGDDDLGIGYRWWAAPDPSKAEILIPATSMPAARTAVRRYHDGQSLERRARSWVAEAMMRIPAVASRALGDDLVAVTGQAATGLPSAIGAALADNVPLDELHMAVTLARPKSNRKPVIQLIDQDGRCIGWAKIGWNPWTRRLVDNEADWLERCAASPLAAPRLIDRLDLCGHRVVITTGVVGDRRHRRRRDRPPPPELLLAIAGLGSRSRLRLDDTPWWASVEQVIGYASDREAAVIEQVARSVGSSMLDVGAWHGDLAPWNIITSGGVGASRSTRQVIDWEFAADGVPLGFDLCHFHTQVGVELKRLTAAEALDRSARLAPQGLARLGVDPHNQINVHRLYLVELIRRTLALRAAGMPVVGVEQGVAATDRLGARPRALDSSAMNADG